MPLIFVVVYLIKRSELDVEVLCGYILLKVIIILCFFLFVRFWRSSPQWARASSFTRFLDHTQRRTTVGRTPLDEWSARRRDLHLKTNKTNNRQISMRPMGFETLISAGERPQTYALERAATGTGFTLCGQYIIYTLWNNHWTQFLFAFFFLFLHLIPWRWKHLYFKKFLNVFIFPYSLYKETWLRILKPTGNCLYHLLLY